MYRTFTDALIRTRAKTILRQHLWPETLEPEYALQHCQGDGVMFTGVLTTEDLLRILPHMHTLTVTMSRTLQRIVSEHGVTVRLSRNTWRYSHSGCATLSVDGFRSMKSAMSQARRAALLRCAPLHSGRS
ncbi:hypothetical protein MUA04_03125 [Enterobacteriaceae bacterium H11S18]|uniref:hypothetical protein n=1 Tax=Dryocola clanedunensis TaxID=2925396 RepID=UPI0022EFDFAC|nr:hypothetical protein [Dryocola clanedunensis]MCT4709189.1 hypothetical protein [Dryocola clanedunensis]